MVDLSLSFHLPAPVSFLSPLASLLVFLPLSASVTPSFCLRCLSDCEFVFHSACQSAATLPRLSGLSTVGWGQGSENLIPHNPSLPGQVAAPLAARTHLRKHTRAYMRAHLRSSWKSGESFCVAWQLGTLISLLGERAAVDKVSLSLSPSAFTCTHETRLLGEIRLSQGIGESNYTCLYWDLFILVSG